jgi:hypothetical protein
MTLTFVGRVDLVGTVAALPLLAISGLISSPVHASEQLQPHSQQVRLLVPLETGFELEQLLPTVPAAQLVRVEGRDYVQLATFADARVAYRLGRTVQKRTKLPFELAYDEAHPQSDGRWLAQEHGVPPSLGIARQESLWQTVPAPMAKALPMPPVSAASADGSRAAPLGGALELQPASPIHTALEPVVAAVLEPLARDPSIQPGAAARSGIRPVVIKAVPLTAVPLVRPHLFAVNANLNYLFVKLQSPEQLAALSRHVAVAEMGERNGELFARVGVFTPTRVGRRLLNQQASRLAAIGYDLEVSHVNT